MDSQKGKGKSMDIGKVVSDTSWNQTLNTTMWLFWKMCFSANLYYLASYMFYDTFTVKCPVVDIKMLMLMF